MEYTFVINIGRQSFTATAHSEEQYEAIKEGFDAIHRLSRYSYEPFTLSDYKELQGEAKETFDAFATYNELWVDEDRGGAIVLKSEAMKTLEDLWKEYLYINEASENDFPFEEYAGDFGCDFEIDK